MPADRVQLNSREFLEMIGAFWQEWSCTFKLAGIQIVRLEEE
jgi:hypothetical protein